MGPANVRHNHSLSSKSVDNNEKEHAREATIFSFRAFVFVNLR